MSKYLSFVPLSMYNIAAFLRSQLFLLPVLLFFYQENGLTVGDFYLIQGLIVFFAFLFEIPAGYLGDIFPRKYILITAYALFLGRLFLWIFFRGFEIILIGEFLYACSKACFDSVSSSFIYDILKRTTKRPKWSKPIQTLTLPCISGPGLPRCSAPDYTKSLVRTFCLSPSLSFIPRLYYCSLFCRMPIVGKRHRCRL